MKFTVRNLVLVLAIVMLASFLMAGILGATILPFRGGSLFNPPTEPFDQIREFEVDAVTAIEADTISTDINIIPVDEGSVIKVHLYGRVTPDVLPAEFARLSGNRLSVNVRPRLAISGNSRIDLTLDIYVPRGYVESLRVDTVSGDLNVTALDVAKINFKSVSGAMDASDLNLESMDFQSVSGNLRGRQFSAGRGDFRTTSGDVDITGYSGHITARSVSGNLTVEFGDFNHNIAFDTTSGRTRLYLPGDAGFTIRLETVSGKVNSDFPLSVHSSSRNRFEGNIGDSDNIIRVKSVSGDVNLNKQ
jgi:lia operon protein LiaG